MASDFGLTLGFKPGENRRSPASFEPTENTCAFGQFIDDFTAFYQFIHYKYFLIKF